MDKLKEITLKSTKTDFEQVQLRSDYEMYKYMKQFYFDDIDLYESFFILILDSQLKTIGYTKISQGGTCGTIVDKKIVAKIAIDSLAHSVVLGHNHPSGVLIPSDCDKRLTSDIVNGLKLFDIKVLDHIILTSNGYFSFFEQGIL